MKKSGFAKGVFWTLSIGIVVVIILAAVGMIAYSGYTNASLEASYSRGDKETKIKIEKKDKLSSEIASVDKKQVKFNEDLLKDKIKLNFKESGPFYGIKENGRMVRGILKGFQNKGFKTDFYGLFTKNQLYWKGYSEIKYDDGKVLYQYNEYKLDENAKVIIDKDGIYQLVDSYLISEEDFAKVRKYIYYDLPIPFDLYNFEETKLSNKTKTKITENNWFSWVEKFPFALKNGTFVSASKLKGINIIKNIRLDSKVYVPDAVNEHFKYFPAVKEDVNYSKYNGSEKKVLAASQNYFGFALAAGYHKDLKTAAKLALSRCRNQMGSLRLEEYPDLECVIVKIGDKRITYREQGYWSELILDKPTLIKKYYETVNSKNFDNKYLVANFIDDQNRKYKKESRQTQQVVTEKPIMSTNEKYYALVIGNNNYEYLEKLDAAENDAEVIADVLTNKYGFEVDLLLNADYDTTVNSLFKITNKLKRNDNLLIYYAGHGELDKAENRGYWLPVDASYELRSKWISNQRIVDRIKATKAKHVLLIADSCFSGTLMRSGTNPDINEAIDDKYIERLKSKKTRLVITSGGNEPVVDSDGGDHSLFALKLIDTLKNNNTVINSQILFENIRRYVVSNADQTPERALVHKTGHDGGDFLFFPK